MPTFYRRMRLRYGMLWGMHGNRRFLLDAVAAVIIGVLLGIVAFRANATVEDDNLAKIQKLKERLELAEANLRGCLTGGFTGVHYYTRDNKRVDIVCDKPAYEIKEN